MMTPNADLSLMWAFQRFFFHGKSCFEWLGPLTSNGYGHFSKGRGTTMLAHRWHWIATFGPFDSRLTIDHICRNRACVRIDHLRLLTSRDNVLAGVGPTAINAKKITGNCGHVLVRVDANRRSCLLCKKTNHAEYQRRRRATLRAAAKSLINSNDVNVSKKN